MTFECDKEIVARKAEVSLSTASASDGGQMAMADVRRVEPSRLNALKSVSGGFASQALSSATNFLLSVMVLRMSDAAAYGVFALAFFGYLLGLNVVRAVVGTAFLLSPAARRHGPSGLGVALALGVLFGISYAAIGAIIAPGDHLTQVSIFAISASFPFLMLQDAQRFSAFARESSQQAATLDLVWLVFMVATYIASRGEADPILCWAGGAAASAVFGVLCHREMRPSFCRCRTFWRVTRLWRQGLLAEALATLVALQLSPYSVALVVGIAGFGALRAAYTILAPINVVMMGVAPVLLAEYQKASGSLRLRHAVRRNASALLAVGTTYVGTILLIPNSIMVPIFGTAVAEAAGLLGYVGVYVVLFAVFCTTIDGLRGVLNPRYIALIRVLVAVAEVLAAIIGGLLGGTGGVAISNALVTTASAVGVAVLFWRATAADGASRVGQNLEIGGHPGDLRSIRVQDKRAILPQSHREGGHADPS